jgi:hypothetical protein
MRNHDRENRLSLSGRAPFFTCTRRYYLFDPTRLIGKTAAQVVRPSKLFDFMGV